MRGPCTCEGVWEAGTVLSDVSLSKKFCLLSCRYRVSFVLVFYTCGQPAKTSRGGSCWEKSNASVRIDSAIQFIKHLQNTFEYKVSLSCALWKLQRLISQVCCPQAAYKPVIFNMNPVLVIL